LSYEGHNLDQLITVLERDSLTLIDWFTENQMKANPDKFQAIAIGKKTKNENFSFNLNGNIITCEDDVKLLGVTIDFELNFNTHIANICKKKASRQLNILKRMGFTYDFYANRWRMCSIGYYFRNSSASINNVTNVNYDIDLQKNVCIRVKCCV
jgi:hypothetical protein